MNPTELELRAAAIAYLRETTEQLPLDNCHSTS
jgi:hypothetical protein